jgi:hypothetical protein
VGGSSGRREFSQGGGSTELRSDTSRKILLKCVGEHQQPMAQLRGLAAGPSGSGSSTANSHIDNLVVAEIPI